MAAKRVGLSQRYYKRALALSELRYDDSAFDFVIGQIDECERLVGEYVEGNGYKSEAVRGAIREWGAGFAAELGALRWKLEAGRRIVSDGRAVMREARDLFNERVSAELLTDAERWLQGIHESFTIPLGECLGLAESGTYFGALEAERNRQREEFCQGLLDQVNDKLNKASKALQAVTAKDDGWKTPNHEGPGPGQNGAGGAGGGWPGGGGAGGGWSGAGGVGAGLGGGLDVDALLERAGSVDGLAPGAGWESEGVGAHGGPGGGRELVGLSDLDGVGLVGRPVNQAVTPNGVVGGYVPPSVVDAGDPRWGAGYRIPSSVVEASRAASAGAVGVVGGVGARSLLSSSLAGGGLSGVAGGRAVPGGRGAAGGSAGGGGVPVAGGGAPGAVGRGEREEEGFEERRGARGLYFDPPESEEEWDPGHGPGSVDDGVEFELDLDEWGLS